MRDKFDLITQPSTYHDHRILLRTEWNPYFRALKHYFGITPTNELIVRRIEARRHDAPNLIKDFQTTLCIFYCHHKLSLYLEPL